ncbi:MAG: ATP-dependent zinc protease [Desulfobulbaceae bacterium]|nr:MAG: ATP-dependent zinc protease [Desulfobulbaceae bacterium]
MKKPKTKTPALMLGWREWLCLPELDIPAIKAKIDTGARTSALHAFHVEAYKEHGRHLVRFGIHPLQKRKDIELFRIAEVADYRRVSDSGGHREMRYVIKTPVLLAGSTWDIEITLTDRESMQFRMLLGRTAMAGHFTIDPQASYLTGLSLKKAYKKEQRSRNTP